MDLISLDGLDDYGKCRDKVSILTADEYKKYRKEIDKATDGPVNDWWRICTPDSTPSGAGSSGVRVVGSSGALGYGSAINVNAVRPFFVLDSSTFVLRERENKDE